MAASSETGREEGTSSKSSSTLVAVLGEAAGCLEWMKGGAGEPFTGLASTVELDATSALPDESERWSDGLLPLGWLGLETSCIPLFTLMLGP